MEKMKSMKKSKDAIVNVEHLSRSYSRLDVTTRRDQYGNLYYVLHVGHCNKQGEWKNQHMLVTDKDLSSLNVLVRKSLFFATPVPKQGFVNASELVNSSKVSGITYA